MREEEKGRKGWGRTGEREGRPRWKRDEGEGKGRPGGGGRGGVEQVPATTFSLRTISPSTAAGWE